MKVILETNRLILRELNSDDAEKIWAMNADPDIIRYTGDKPFHSVDEARQFILNYDDYRKNGFGRWAVISKTNDEFLGWCGLKKNEEDAIDLGFRFLKAHWNRGYASESAKACLDYAFHQLNLDEIVGRAAKENRASIRILQKIGMEFWKEGVCHGIDDSAYFRINKEKYFRLNG